MLGEDLRAGVPLPCTNRQLSEGRGLLACSLQRIGRIYLLGV